MCFIDAQVIQKLWDTKYKALAEAKIWDTKELRITIQNDYSYSTTVQLYRIPATSYVAGFTLSEFPGSTAIISSAAGVLPSYQGRGLGKLLNQFRLEIAGDNMMLCTVNDTNVAQHKVLLINGWRRLRSIDGNSSLWMHESGRGI